MIVSALIGWILILGAAFALGRQAHLWWQSGTFEPLALGQLWYDLDPGSLNLAQAVVQRYLLPELWDPGIITLLQWPSWAVLGIPGIGLTALSWPTRGRRRRRRRRRLSGA